MTFLDKAKVAAEKAAARAQQGVQQGQAKLDAIQTKRRADALLRELGAAYYAEQRRGADLGEGVRQLSEIAQPQVGERLADLVVRIVESMRVGGIEDDVTILAAKRAEPRS
jgi:ribosome recycling factor